MELDARLEGWLYVAYGLDAGYGPAGLVWHRRYCVLEPQLKKFYVLKDEQSAQSVSNNAVVRLDDDCKDASHTEEVCQKPLVEVFDAGTRLTQIQQSRISKRIKSSGVRHTARDAASTGDLPSNTKSNDKAISILGMNRSQSMILDPAVTSKAAAILGLVDEELSPRGRSPSWGDPFQLPSVPPPESPVTEKAVAILGMSRTQSIANGFDRSDSVAVDNNNTSIGNSNSMIWTVYLGSDSPPLIRLVHHSLSGREHTFCVETSKRSVYLACRSNLELHRWLDSLSHVVDPLKEERVQLDQSLTVWVVEAKHLPKKRYYVEVFLDTMFCSRTVTKSMAEMLFWGENFSFSDLRTFRKVRIVLRREVKHKKAAVVGETEILVKNLVIGTEHEHWYNLSTTSCKTSSGSIKDPMIRVKLKLQVLTVLPLNYYEEILKYLTTSSIVPCNVLEPFLSVRHKEELAHMLLHILQDFGKAHDFLVAIVMQEVDKTEDPSLLFRGNSIATKSVDIYMKLIGSKYLKATLGMFIKDIYENASEFEVDMTRMPPGEDYLTNQQNMMMYVDKAWALILSSYPKFPPDLRHLFSTIWKLCADNGREDVSKKLISGSIFLRFFCPAIMSPSLFNLTNEYPDEKIGRCLILTAKVIMNLANFSRFGGKEEYMSFMNEFVESAMPNMDLFLSKISEPVEHDYKSAEIYMNIGHGLSSLHLFLRERLTTLNEDSLAELNPLPAILRDLDDTCESRPSDVTFLYGIDPLAESVPAGSQPDGAQVASNRRRKAGSLPAILVNENERQKLQTRSYRSFGSVEEARENAKACSAVTYKPTKSYSTNESPTGRCSGRSPPDGDTEPEEPGKANSNERMKPNGSDNVDEVGVDGRRRSLPVVPEEQGLNPAVGRQMSDPLTSSVYTKHSSEDEDQASQLSVALDNLSTLRHAIGDFLHTHTGRNPTSDVEVIQMLELLSAALVKDG